MIGPGGLLAISVSDWSIIMIGPGGLLAIRSYLLSKFEFDGWGCKKVNN
jgi:hypothetical protein